MFYSCTHMATVGVKGSSAGYICDPTVSRLRRVDTTLLALHSVKRALSDDDVHMSVCPSLSVSLSQT